MNQLGLDFAVTFNGQYIINSNHDVLKAEPIDKTNVRELAEFADENKREMMFGSDKALAGSRLLRAGNSNAVRLLSPFIPHKLADTLKNGYKGVVRSWRPTNYQKMPILRMPVYQVVMVSTEKEQSILEQQFPSLTFTRSNPYSVDIIPQGGSKIKGIAKVCDEIGVDLSEVMAFGDSWNDIEMISGVGYGVAMGNGVQALKDIADFVTTSNDKDGIARAFQQFGLLENDVLELEEVGFDDVVEAHGRILSDEAKQMDQHGDFIPAQYSKEHYYLSKDENFNKVKKFHYTFDKAVSESPSPYSIKGASFRTGFKVEELVEFLYATADNDPEVFKTAVDAMHKDIDKAVAKIEKKGRTIEDPIVDQADALVDMLYFVYGSFVLMGVDPQPLFDYVHDANMAKLWPDGKAHYDPVTHKILKPEDWEENHAPEEKIKEEIARQMKNGIHL
jgi:Cof subfamily protein (haloacid dehalogenase superfamily)